jgi:predicted dehydrogenase
MADTARAQGRFLMEALWSRFLPSYVALRKLLEDGRIGEPLMLDASFGFRAPIDPTHRLFNRALGGGSLLDLGIYPIHLSSLVFGAPEAVQAVGHIGTTAVDESVAALLRHPSGGITSLRASIRANLPSNAVLSGSDGVVELPTPMHHPRTLVVTDPDGTTTTIDAAHEGNGLRFQAEDVHRCLAAGLHESPVLPLEESCQFAATMDAVRAQIGMRYDVD